MMDFVSVLKCNVITCDENVLKLRYLKPRGGRLSRLLGRHVASCRSAMLTLWKDSLGHCMQAVRGALTLCPQKALACFSCGLFSRRCQYIADYRPSNGRERMWKEVVAA
jgi:hypothetical protein